MRGHAGSRDRGRIVSRVLVFGADGLIGHYLVAGLARDYKVGGTLHGVREAYPAGYPNAPIVAWGVDAANVGRVHRALDDFRPDWVINAVGLVKRDKAADAVASLEANTLFPHRLSQACGERNVRLLHFSTDCVFAGNRGRYRETDLPDNQDWHGRCKALGEPSGEHVLVLRTSFIGLELACRRSLVEWFLAQRGAVPGYTRAIWSGLTAAELVRVVGMLMARRPAPHGLWHLAGPSPITKYELLCSLNRRLGDRGVTVVPDGAFVCDRSLDGSAFNREFSYLPLSWDAMLDELVVEILASGRLAGR